MELSKNIEILWSSEGLFWSLKSFSGKKFFNRLASIPERSKSSYAFRVMSKLFTTELGGVRSFQTNVNSVVLKDMWFKVRVNEN